MIKCILFFPFGIIIWRFTHVDACINISFFYHWGEFVCMDVLQIVCPFSYWRTFRLFPVWDNYVMKLWTFMCKSCMDIFAVKIGKGICGLHGGGGCRLLKSFGELVWKLHWHCELTICVYFKRGLGEIMEAKVSFPRYS